MKIILDDISCRNDLYPFTLTRSVADIRIGILTIREKWEKFLGEKVSTISELKENIIHKNIKQISANILPSKKDSEKQIVIQYPWHIFQNNACALQWDFELITKDRISQKISSTNKIIGDEKKIFIEEGAVVEHCTLNCMQGIIYVGKNAEIMEGCNIRGHFAMCEGSILKMGAKIYGASTLGPYCIGAGEIKNSILFGYSNKSHDGYLGDSIIGEWCNLGAGTTNSNIKNTVGQIMVWNDFNRQNVSAGLKCGLLMGDYSRSAINTSFNTGTVVGSSCNVFQQDTISRFIQSFSWGNKRYHLDKALKHIENWKSLKGKTLAPNEKKILTKIYNQLK